MAEQREERASLSGLVAIVVAVGAFVWYQKSPLESSRPPQPPPTAYKPSEHGKIEARLWQDPLETVKRHLDKVQQPAGERQAAQSFDVKVTSTPRVAPPPSTDRAQLDLQATVTTGDAAQPDPSLRPQQLDALQKLLDPLEGEERPEVVVLGVMLQGGAHGEAAEVRRRTRYAVVSALLDQWFPVDAESLRYFLYPLSKLAQKPDDPQGNLVVPYEWFTRDSLKSDVRTKQRVLVLWLNDAWFAGNPLRKLHELIIGVEGTFERNFPWASYRIKIIGPPDSGRLQEMIDELGPPPLEAFRHSRDDQQDEWNNTLAALQPRTWCPQGEIGAGAAGEQARFELLAAHPTTEPLFWKSRAVERAIGADLLYGVLRKRLPDVFWRQCSIQLTRAIGADFRLTDALIRELRRRGFAIGRDRIAVVAEADTEYGRYFPTQLRSAYSLAPGGAGSASATCDPVADPQRCRVDYFSYMRGLDGVAPGDTTPAPRKRTDDKPDKAEAAKARAADSGETADGTSQQDYLRRLVDRIRLANELDDVDQRGRIRAIGVLGSDVYDKLLVLRALRDAFPTALFFTTDLDARLLQPTENRWTRNLIVASSFGFELHRNLQGHTPPFRDNYQTASFLATRLAIAKPGERPEIALDDLLDPRLFEIGRSSAVDLTALDAGADPGCPTLSRCKGLHPPHVAWPVHKRVWVALAAAGAFGLLWFLGFFFSTQVRAASRSAWSALRWCAGAGRPYVKQAVVSGVYAAAALSAILYGFNGPLYALRYEGSGVYYSSIALATLVACAIGYAAWRYSARGAAPPPRLGTTALASAAAGLIGTALVWIVIAGGDGHEPWSLFEGVSVWPAIIVRAVAVVLSAYFLFAIRNVVETSERNLASRFALPAPDALRVGLPTFRELLKSPASRDAIRITTWGSDSLQRDPRPPRTAPVDVVDLWRRFVRCGTWQLWCYRSLVLAAVAFLVCYTLFWLLGFPSVPYRGPASRAIYYAVIVLNVFLFLWLVFAVVDLTKLSQRMINQLSAAPSNWGKATYYRFRRQVRLEREIAGEWIDLRWIAEHTAAVGGIIYYPAVIVLLLLLARHRAFDNFELNVALVIVLSAAGAMAVGCAVMVRRAAERARRISAERVLNRLLAAKSAGHAESAAQLELLLRQIEGLREGAFAPYGQQPLLRALLLPLGGVGGAAMLESLALFGV